MRVRLVLATFFLCLLPFSARADRGSVPCKKGVSVFEPVQRAMIAWNGEEEILLLSTDLRVSERTKVLEVLPLPGKPEVSEGDVKVFRRATAPINGKLAKMRQPAFARRKGYPWNAAPGISGGSSSRISRSGAQSG